MAPKRRTSKTHKPKRPPRPQAERVLIWIERFIRTHALVAGEALPTELEIGKAAGAGRSSVREALTALKALGILVSKRKGGIRLVRDPVLLHLRRYLVERYEDTARHTQAMEFRAALELGLAELVFANIEASDLRHLEGLVEACRKTATRQADLLGAEIAFHTRLIRSSGNELAALLAGIVTPVFSSYRGGQACSKQELAVWTSQHMNLIAALKKGDRARFLKAMATHTLSYMRLGPK